LPFGSRSSLAASRRAIGTDALDLGLVDAVAGLEESVLRAKRAAGLSEARVVRYHRPREYANNLYTRGSPIVPRLTLEFPGSRILAIPPGFYFLWAPELP